MTVRRQRSIGAAPERIWELISDPYRLPAWWPGVERVEEASERGWTKVLRSPKGGKAVRADYTVVDAVPPTSVSWRHEVEESPFERIMSEARYDFDLEERASETLVRLRMQVRLRGFSRLGALQMRRATSRRLDEALEGLAELVA